MNFVRKMSIRYVGLLGIFAHVFGGFAFLAEVDEGWVLDLMVECLCSESRDFSQFVLVLMNVIYDFLLVILMALYLFCLNAFSHDK